MINKLALISLLFFILPGCYSENSIELSSKPVDGVAILTNVLTNLNHDYPGRGLADYPSDESVDVPKGYAMILLGAEAEAKLRKLGSINDLGTKAGNWLIENADANDDGIIGWGVPVAWDAYGDGSINPENTEYSISTAIVVDALLGWLNYVDDEKKQIIMDLVEKAFTPYFLDTMRTPAGLLPYSLLHQDRKYDTFNSAVYLAAQMQRFSTLVVSPELKRKLQDAADATMAALLEHKKKAPNNGSWYWNYSIQENNPNDLPHAGYIIEGVLVYIENNGRLASRFDQKRIFGHLMDFFEKEGKVRSMPIFTQKTKTPPRLYDLSIGAQLMCRFRSWESGTLFLGEVNQYAIPEGGHSKYPFEMNNNRRVAEYEAYLYRALMSCGCNGSNNAQ